jgi:hypothetical protein
MKLIENLKALAGGLLRLPALLRLGLEALENRDNAAVPIKTAGMGSEVISEPRPEYRPPAGEIEQPQPALPVYSLKRPSPAWQGDGAGLAPEAAQYPALNAEKPAQIEDVAELVYRRIDFDSRLVSQPMDGEEA